MASQTTPLTPEQYQSLVDLLPVAVSLRSIAEAVGARLDQVRIAAAPLLAVMRLQGVHPICGCGKLRFHLYGCSELGVRLEAHAKPGSVRAAQQERRQLIIAEIMTGDPYSEIERRLGMTPKTVRNTYLHHLTPEQRAERKRLEAERRSASHRTPSGELKWAA